MATFQPVISILENAAQEPLPAALVAVGGLVVLKFALGVSVAGVCFMAAKKICSHLIIYAHMHLNPLQCTSSVNLQSATHKTPLLYLQSNTRHMIAPGHPIQISIPSINQTYQMWKVCNRNRRYRWHW